VKESLKKVVLEYILLYSNPRSVLARLQAGAWILKNSFISFINYISDKQYTAVV